jgi:hypothetical protein
MLKDIGDKLDFLGADRQYLCQLFFLGRNLYGQNGVKVRATPIDLVNNSDTNYFFCSAICLVKMGAEVRTTPL